ncbi:hypothetical protein [Microbacterium panaciterrae]|uniref:Uncharacterized protein n=1 Tax=Microbacterium panaciterrae TaxID=985759 RepID=A0ABP8PCX3_9MICO
MLDADIGGIWANRIYFSGAIDEGTGCPVNSPFSLRAPTATARPRAVMHGAAAFGLPLYDVVEDERPRRARF